MLEQLIEGLRYVLGFRPIRSLMLLLAWLCLVGMPFSVLMPVFADEILGGGPHTLGLLMGASGRGALPARCGWRRGSRSSAWAGSSW